MIISLAPFVLTSFTVCVSRGVSPCWSGRRCGKWNELLPCDCCAVIDSNKAWRCSKDKVWVWKAMLLSKNMWVIYSNGIANSCLFAPRDKILALLLVCAFFRLSKVKFVSTLFFGTEGECEFLRGHYTKEYSWRISPTLAILSMFFRALH